MVQLGNKPAIVLALLLAFAAVASAMPTEHNSLAAVTLSEAIIFGAIGVLCLLAGLIMLGYNFSYPPLQSGAEYSEKELRAIQQLEANQRRRVLFLVVGFGCLMIGAGAFALYGKIGTTVRAVSPVKVNAIFYIFHGIAYGCFAAVFASFMNLKSKSTMVLVAASVAMFGVLGAAQYAPFGYWRGFAIAVVAIGQVAGFFAILGGSDPGAVVIFSARAFAPCLFMALSFLLWDIFYMVGSPNENSKNASLDSRSGTQLGFMGANIAALIAIAFCMGLMHPVIPGLTPPLKDPMTWGYFSDTMGAAPAETRRRRGEDGMPLTGGASMSFAFHAGANANTGVQTQQ
jgi:MFS family permease